MANVFSRPWYSNSFKDLLGTTWNVILYKIVSDPNLTPKQLQFSANPLRFYKKLDEDDKMSPIHSIQLDLGLALDKDSEILDFIRNANAKDITILVQRDNQNYYRGIYVPDTVQWNYQSAKQEVVITFVCGLAALKNYQLTDYEGDQYYGQETIGNVIVNCLKNIYNYQNDSVTLFNTEIFDLFVHHDFLTKNGDGSFSLFDLFDANFKIAAGSIFRDQEDTDPEVNSMQDCYTVLKNICLSLGCNIIQRGGTGWYITEVAEFISNSNTYRHYRCDWTSGTITRVSDVDVNNSYAIGGTGNAIFARNDAVLSYDQAVQEALITYNGSDKITLPNTEFKKWDDGVPAGWSIKNPNGATEIINVNNIMKISPMGYSPSITTAIGMISNDKQPFLPARTDLTVSIKYFIDDFDPGSDHPFELDLLVWLRNDVTGKTYMPLLEGDEYQWQEVTGGILYRLPWNAARNMIYDDFVDFTQTIKGGAHFGRIEVGVCFGYQRDGGSATVNDLYIKSIGLSLGNFDDSNDVFRRYYGGVVENKLSKMVNSLSFDKSKEIDSVIRDTKEPGFILSPNDLAYMKDTILTYSDQILPGPIGTQLLNDISYMYNKNYIRIDSSFYGNNLDHYQMLSINGFSSKFIQLVHDYDVKNCLYKLSLVEIGVV